MVELEKRGFDTAAFLASADQGSLLDSRRRQGFWWTAHDQRPFLVTR